MTRRQRRGERVLAWFALLVAAPARAGNVDPSLGAHLVVGVSTAAAAMDRLDAARTARSSAELPHVAHVAWRTRVDGGIAPGLAVDRDGTTLVVHAGTRLTAIARSGVVTTSTRLPGDALIGPVLTRDSTRVIVTSVGIFGVRPDGVLRFQFATQRTREHNASGPVALALDDGSVLVAANRALYWLDSDGSARASLSAPESIVALLADGATLFAIGRSGTVFEYLPWGSLEARGGFGGSVDGECMLVGPRRFVAVVANRRVMDYDLTTGLRSVRLDSATEFEGPTALGTDAGVWLPIRDTLREVSAVGKDLRTIPLAAMPGAGSALVIDAPGGVAFASPGTEVALANPAGETKRVAGAACDQVAALVPAGARRLVLACASGLVLGLTGDQ